MPQYITSQISLDIESVRDMAKYDSLLKAERAASALYKRTLENGIATDIAESAMCLAGIKRHLRAYDEAHSLYTQALSVWNTESDADKAALCIIGIEVIQSYRAHNPPGIKRVSDILDTDISPATAIQCHLCLGTLYVISADYLSAMEHFERAIHLAQEGGFIEEYLWGFMNLGEVYIYTGDFDTALQCLHKSLSDNAPKEHLGLRAYTYSVLCDVYTELQDWEKALEAVNRSYEYYDKAERDSGKALVLARKAMIYRSCEQYDDAYQCLMDAEPYLNSADIRYIRKNFLLHVGWLLSIAQWERHDFTRAKQFLTECIALCDDLSDRSTKARALEILSTVFEEENDYAKALDYQKQLYQTSLELEQERVRLLSETNEIKNQLRLSQKERELLAEKYTELGVLNAQLRQKTEQLAEQQRDIERYNVELLQSNIALQRSYEQKSEVVAIAAHQLKSPLVEISYLAKDALLKKPNEDVGERLGEIDTRISQLLSNIERFLTLSSISDRNALHIRQVRVDLVISDVIAMIHQNAHLKNIDIVVNSENNLVASTDEFALTQIVENLLSNAIKYSPPGSRVYVSSSSEREASVVRSVTLIIRDEGKGFSENDKQFMFEKFRRLSAQPTGNESSSGLGLSIVKNFVTVLGGTINIESQEGRGATFMVHIPCHNE